MTQDRDRAAPRAVELHLVTGRVRLLPPEQASRVSEPVRRELVHLIPAGTRTLADLHRVLAEIEPLVATVVSQVRFYPWTGLSERGERALAALVTLLGRDGPAPASSEDEDGARSPQTSGRGAFVWCDHPGWSVTASGRRRTVRTEHGVWTAQAHTDLTVARVGESLGPAPVVDVYSPAVLGPRVPDALRQALQKQGPVQRLRTPSLWEALATAIIRQVARADQAQAMFARFCDAHGAPLPDAPTAFPRPEAVLALAESDFAELGMAFKRRPLLAAAEALLEFGLKWADLAPQDLVVEVQSVPRIGRWTAGAAVADATGDFSLYPYADMAVRKCAAQAVPVLGRSDDEPAFARWWRSLTTTPTQLSTLTVLTLALGGPRGQDRTPL
ncbi:hypothetical protein [Nocardiopsis synnemataformans]|uniref:hypothetical protein n=1 Tax=Nocardiopsis synnemataformans TaxID=61305 RepID=UPI003EBD6DA8